MSKPEIMDVDEEFLEEAENRRRYTVCVIGCGRMGLPHACLFADAGYNVIGVDKNLNVVNAINSGKTPLQEPGIQSLITRHVGEGRLKATSNTESAVSESDIILLVVDTSIDEKMRPDYSMIERACREIGRGLRRGSIVIVTSTVGPGVSETLIRGILEDESGLEAGRDFGLAFSPIHASSGRILHDIMNYIRVVAGIDDRSLKVASHILNTIVKSGTVTVSSIKAAEAVKLFQNVYRDVNMALANEFAIFCERAGIDYSEVQHAANMDPYCHLPLPGLVSGHIPKDPYLLINEAENLGVNLKIAKAARKTNENMVKHAAKLVRDALRECGKTLRGAEISVLGISYKANVKERRGSRAINLIRLLGAKGAKVRVYDPYYTTMELEDLGCRINTSLKSAIRGADCIVIAVGHDKFKKINLHELKVYMKMPAAIIDLSHTLNPEDIREEGIVYRGFGRGKHNWAK